MLQIRRALRPQGDDDVEEGAACGPEQLRLSGRGKLKMHAPHRAFFLAEDNVGLRDDRLQAVIGELALTEGPGEEPTTILAAIQIDEEGALQSAFREDHRSARSQ